MSKRQTSQFLLLVSLLLFSRLAALPSYIGYSGAPGTLGSCAIHCHGTTGGSILVSGFPTTYVPGDTYRVVVKHNGGDAISNFNASVRVDSGSATAGTLLADLNTEVYSAGSPETMGVHFAGQNQDSGAFLWAAPVSGTGDVTLYLAGMQGLLMDGPNTRIVLAATESPGGVAESGWAPQRLSLELLNRIVAGYLILQADLPTGAEARLRILDMAGRVVTDISLQPRPGLQIVVWEPDDTHGRRLVAGNYFATLLAGNQRRTRKFIIAR